MADRFRKSFKLLEPDFLLICKYKFTPQLNWALIKLGVGTWGPEYWKVS